MKKAEERDKAELEVESGFVDLFGLSSSQSQMSDDPPNPPPQCIKWHPEETHKVDGNDDDDNDDDDEYDNGSGGRKGGGCGGCGGGGGMEKSATGCTISTRRGS